MMIKIAVVTIAGMLLSGCNNDNNIKKEPPAGYSKPITLGSQVIYFVKDKSIFFQGNKDLLQTKIVTSFKTEDELKKIKFKSMKATHVYDCRKNNKYMEKPDGFFSDEYAVGNPVIPYPETISVWKIARNGTLNQMVWDKLCGIGVPRPFAPKVSN